MEAPARNAQSESSGEGPSLVLASASDSRAALLRGAGVSFEVRISRVDESAVKQSLRSTDTTGVETARTLAVLKARRVSMNHPGAYVIGADQLLMCDGERFDKPADQAEARRQLLALRGRSHELVTAVAVVRDDAVLWTDTARPRLAMRPFSDAFLESYLARAGNAIPHCPGAYKVEGLGVQLFDEITGDWSAILGLPLVPLLAFLREHRMLAT